MNRIKEDANQMLKHIREELMIDPHWDIKISDEPKIESAQICMDTRYKKGDIEINLNGVKTSSELFELIRHEVIHVLISGMDSMDSYIHEVTSGKTRGLMKRISYDLNENLLLHLEHLFQKNNLCCYNGYSGEEVTYANEEIRKEEHGKEASQKSSQEASQEANTSWS
jgi:hypothetical protein